MSARWAAMMPALAAFGVTLTACSGPTDTVLISSLDVISGNGQIAAPSTVLPQPIVFRVTATNGAGIPGQTVTFQVTDGGGTVTPTSAVSDARSLVSVTWTLGPSLSGDQILVQVDGATTSGSPIVATLVATPDKPTVTVMSGNGQVSTVGTHVPQPIVIQLTTSAGAPLANYTFTLRSLTCHSLDGSCDGVPADDQLAGTTLTTGADGTAAFTGWTLGTTPNIKCLGLYPGTSLPQNSTDTGLGRFVCATAEPGPPAKLAQPSPDNQQAAAGSTLTVAVIVEDQFGNHVGCWAQTTICIDPNAPEVQVTFTPSAGGTASPGQTMTYQGEALTGWTIAPGVNTLTITVGTLSATYTATGT